MGAAVGLRSPSPPLPVPSISACQRPTGRARAAKLDNSVERRLAAAAEHGGACFMPRPLRAPFRQLLRARLLVIGALDDLEEPLQLGVVALALERVDGLLRKIIARDIERVRAVHPLNPCHLIHPVEADPICPSLEERAKRRDSAFFIKRLLLIIGRRENLAEAIIGAERIFDRDEREPPKEERHIDLAHAKELKEALDE